MIAFFRRPYPSANAVLLTGSRPVLVDPGFGADIPALEAWLHANGTPPERLALVVNTHFDCDHVGANHGFAGRHGLPVAAGAAEAAMVNARHPEACRARWLHQPVEPYRVALTLREGDVIGTGTVDWQVLDTPGHTAGHISLYAPAVGALVVGDAVHADDVGWLDPRRPGVLDEAAGSITRLAALRPRVAYCGHGAPAHDPAAAFATALRRLDGWRRAPERMAWHGIKRVFVYALMIEDGLSEPALLPYLMACPWFLDYAAQSFGQAPAAFADRMLAEVVRAGAARWVDGRLMAQAAYVPPAPGWLKAPADPACWPR